MTRGTNVMAALAIAAAIVLGMGASSVPASAQVYPACAPGYYYWAGYCYPYASAYYPPVYFGAPFFFPAIGFGFGFGGFHSFDHDDFHGGFHGGGFSGGGFHGGGHR